MCAMIAFTACKKEKANTIPEKAKPEYSNIKKSGRFDMHFNNMVNGANITLDSVWYVTDSKDTFTVSEFKYFITNIMLHTEGASTYAEPNSYHLIDQRNEESLSFSVKDVPPGRYHSMTFTIGVDSARTVQGDYSGDLSKDAGMFWNTDFGFIIAKLEGKSPQSPAASGYKYHVGGYKGVINSVRTVTIPFQKTREIDGNVQYLNLDADAARFFYGEHNIRIATFFELDEPDVLSEMLADNYKYMFRQTDY